jgi:hypothetical protein
VAKKAEDVMSPELRELADRLGVPEPDWYVGSAESGRGAPPAQVAEELMKQKSAGENDPEPAAEDS